MKGVLSAKMEEIVWCVAEVQLSTISSVPSISNKGIMKTDARRLQICLTV